MVAKNNLQIKRYVNYEPKINCFEYSPLPDEYNGPIGNPPPEDFVISRDQNGNIVSFYGDSVWDMTAYQRRYAFGNLHFDNWFKCSPDELHYTIIDEMKWLIFLEIYCAPKALSVSTLQNRINLLNNMARFAHERSNTLTEILTNPLLFTKYLDFSSRAKHLYHTISTLVNNLMTMGTDTVGFRLLTGVTRAELRKLSTEWNYSTKQHAPIPTRIYAELIDNLMEELKRFEAVVEPFLALVEECALNPTVGRTHSKRPNPTFFELIAKYELESYINYVDNQHDYSITSVKKLSRWTKTIQFVCNQIVHIFSGMRDAEANRLPVNCLEIYRHNGKRHYRIAGGTTKLTKEVLRPARWVTSSHAAKAIMIAQKIASVIYKIIDDIPKGDNLNSSYYPLFIGNGYLGFGGGHKRSLKPPYSSSVWNSFLLPNLLPLIENGDILELESIDPFRAWRTEEEFKIGNRWHVTDHKYRRSLAIYASASGLVTLPSLRRNLQNITEEMAVYYAKGSAYAKSLSQANKNHFSFEYQGAQPESQALAYIAQTLLSDEPLFGAHGTWIKRHIDIGQNITPDFRRETIKRFERGEIAYKNTPLGGCTTVDPCNMKAIRSIVACLDCNKAIIKQSKLDRVIKLQKAFLARLDPDSIEGRAKKADIEKLKEYLEHIEDKQEIAID